MVDVLIPAEDLGLVGVLLRVFQGIVSEPVQDFAYHFFGVRFGATLHALPPLLACPVILVVRVGPDILLVTLVSQGSFGPLLFPQKPPFRLQITFTLVRRQLPPPVKLLNALQIVGDHFLQLV